MADMDLEDELLIAAGHTRGRGTPGGGKGRRRNDGDDEELFGSASEEEAESSEEDDDDDFEAEERPKKATRRGRKAAKKAPSSEEDEDDGSDLYIDEEDRKRLEAMTELEREMILSDRAEERDKQRQRKTLMKAAKAEKVGCHAHHARGGHPFSRMRRGRESHVAAPEMRAHLVPPDALGTPEQPAQGPGLV